MGTWYFIRRVLANPNRGTDNRFPRPTRDCNLLPVEAPIPINLPQSARCLHVDYSIFCSDDSPLQ